MCGFLRLSSPKFSNEKNRRGGKRNTKRQDLYSPNSSKYRLKEAKNVRGKKCLGFMVRPKLLRDNKLCAMINVPQWVTKYKQIHCQVCLFTCASFLVRVPKWRVSIHQNQLTHTHTHTRWFTWNYWGNRQTNSFWHKLPLTFANLSKASPFPGIICTVIFFSSVFRGTSVLWASKLETRLQLFSLQKHLSKQQQSQGQVSPVSVGDSSWQKFSRDNS